jgi:hypothetical protein
MATAELTKPAPPCSTPMKLEGLPDEIQVEIFGNLSTPYLSTPHLSLSMDLYNLCLVKLFNRIRTELLYQDFLGICPRRIYEIVRTLVERPDLGLFVKNLDIEDIVILHEEDGLRYRDIPLETTANLVRYIKSLGIPRMMQRYWLDALNNEATCGFILIAILLPLTPNVTSWDFRTVHHWKLFPSDKLCPPHLNNCYFWSVALPQLGYQPMTRPLPSLHTLKRIEIRSYENSELRMSQLAPLFNISSLERLVIHDFFDENPPSTWTWNLGHFQEQGSNIKYLDLWRVAIHPESVALIIRACKALEVFQYCDEEPDMGSPISSALGKHNHCLKKLCLCCYPNFEKINPTHEDVEVTLQPETLSVFRNLTILHVDHNILGDIKSTKLSSILPNSLEALHIGHILGDENTFIGAGGVFSDLVGNGASVFPQLRYLRMAMCEDPEDLEDPELPDGMDFKDKNLVLEMKERGLRYCFVSHQNGHDILESIPTEYKGIRNGE